jgi:peroxiredoxin Q/BCP
MLNEGDKAPEFELPIEDGSLLSLKSLRGQTVVLYFYPKDDTSGCTREAIDFTENLEEFDRLGAKVIGISPDAVSKHQKFRDKHNLKVTLVSDEDKTAAELYGVWAEKKMYGRTYMGIVRTTFLIDAEGNINKIWRKVKVAGHAAAVLEAANTLVSP